MVPKKAKDTREALRLQLEGLGATSISLAGADSSGKALMLFTHTECGTEQTWRIANLTKRLSIEAATCPCSSCGGKRRAAKATLGRIEQARAKRES